ncbi:ThiF family adenylyltransferase [Scytonema hofmannii FACHB-248]|uniref:ThiF family adenylyltransferase n=1 Tax=Scytonema hofmannii FACHB-248 TaxID=1842502 RepID=A0ABR8GLA1_9CYAN|nr:MULTISPECIES: ThiF family adenylyltransferase [Nostocales]MBD2604098.1 ThiF family adenylyltransferase [Scytonema hofmannii FACHB-248]
MIQIDTEFFLPVLPRPHRKVNFILVGAGGTGGYLAEDVCRLIVQLQQNEKKANLTIIDGDSVEPKNIARQNYQPSEISFPKAQCLATRCSAKYGVEVTAISDWFSPNHVENYKWNTLTIIIGCVDNAATRAQIHSCLKYNSPRDEQADLFWLDCGNSSLSGQVILGTHADFNIVSASNNPDKPAFWKHLPSPALVHPELLIPKPEELSSNNLSCAEIQILNHQTLFINRMTSAIASQYLLELTLIGKITKFVSYFNLIPMSCRSIQTTVKNLDKYHIV